MPIVCPNCGRVLARRCAGYVLIVYKGREYEVGLLHKITCRCKTTINLPPANPLTEQAG